MSHGDNTLEHRPDRRQRGVQVARGCDRRLSRLNQRRLRDVTQKLRRAPPPFPLSGDDVISTSRRDPSERAAAATCVTVCATASGASAPPTADRSSRANSVRNRLPRSSDRRRPKSDCADGFESTTAPGYRVRPPPAATPRRPPPARPCPRAVIGSARDAQHPCEAPCTTSAVASIPGFIDRRKRRACLVSSPGR